MNRWERRIQNAVEAVAQRYRNLPRECEQYELSIHQARRLTKQLRSVLALMPKEKQRLAKKRLGRLRCIARELGFFRDESIFRRNLLELKLRSVQACSGCSDDGNETSGNLSGDSIPALLDEMVRNSQAIVKKLKRDHLHISRTMIVKQFKRSIVGFRRDFKRLSAESELELWHAWRKSGKLLEYQLRLLRKWNGELCPIADLVITLGKHLGRLNDLAKAEEAMVSLKSPAGEPINMPKVVRDEILKGVAEGCVAEKEQATHLMTILAPQLKELLKAKPRKLIL